MRWAAGRGRGRMRARVSCRGRCRSEAGSRWLVGASVAAAPASQPATAGRAKNWAGPGSVSACSCARASHVHLKERPPGTRRFSHYYAARSQRRPPPLRGPLAHAPQHGLARSAHVGRVGLVGRAEVEVVRRAAHPQRHQVARRRRPCHGRRHMLGRGLRALGARGRGRAVWGSRRQHGSAAPATSAGATPRPAAPHGSSSPLVKTIREPEAATSRPPYATSAAVALGRTP